MAPRYPKTQSLWKRDMTVECNDCYHLHDKFTKECEECGGKTSKLPGHGLIIPGAYTWKMFENINRWHVTEKIHGQNIRIVLNAQRFDNAPNEYTVDFGGRKGGESSIQKMLLPRLKEHFIVELMQETFPLEEEQYDKQVVLYGEGYGPGIQSWHYDLEQSNFILFDVLVDNVWLEQDAVTDIANQLGIERVPVLGENLSTADAVMKCYGEPESVLTPGHPMEGIVARSNPLVLHRVKKTPIQWKLKVRDYTRLLAWKTGEPMPEDEYKGF